MDFTKLTIFIFAFKMSYQVLVHLNAPPHSISVGKNRQLKLTCHISNFTDSYILYISWRRWTIPLASNPLDFLIQFIRIGDEFRQIGRKIYTLEMVSQVKRISTSAVLATLFVNNFTSCDEGRYSCLVRALKDGRLREIKDEKWVNIHTPYDSESITVSPSTVHLRSNEVTILCIIPDVEPFPQASWFRQKASSSSSSSGEKNLFLARRRQEETKLHDLTCSYRVIYELTLGSADALPGVYDYYCVLSGYPFERPAKSRSFTRVFYTPTGNGIRQAAKTRVRRSHRTFTCANRRCFHGGTCVMDTKRGSHCLCKPGFQGRQCEHKKYKCAKTCVHGHCQRRRRHNGYLCKCKQGFYGEACETEINECKSRPCGNNGTCVDKVAQFQCLCMKGFDGRTCGVDIDECLSWPCQNAGNCRDFAGGYICDCPENYAGTNCEMRVCETHPCKNGGTCHTNVLGNGFSCTCAAGFRGARCELDTDECRSKPCQNGATCQDGSGTFACICQLGFTGKYCETVVRYCTISSCLNNGTCVAFSTGIRCDCQPGFMGADCSQNFDECSSSPCKNGGRCEDGINEFACKCSHNFMGQMCELLINMCTSDHCKNGGRCRQGMDGITCTCLSGFTGKLCESDIDECSSNPCKHGAVCTDVHNGYTCNCQVGFKGRNCQHDIDECLSRPCNNQGRCIDGMNSFQCICPVGFTGAYCNTDVNECQSYPCKNSGICRDKVNGYYCVCPKPFVGRHCEYKTDYCISSPCSSEQTCFSTMHGYECSCPPNKFGDHCELSRDICASTPCQNGGRCRPTGYGYICTCQRRFSGEHCEYEHCSVNLCKNNGTCMVSGVDGDYSCLCQPGFQGAHCEMNHDECLSSPCKQGYCIDGVNKYVCACVDGFHGVHCNETTPCTENVCHNNATCIAITDESFRCLCPPEYSGVMCEKKITCGDIDCGANSVCLETSSGAECTCKPSYAGQNCDHTADTQVNATTPPVLVVVPRSTLVAYKIMAGSLAVCVTVFGLGMFIICCQWRGRRMDKPKWSREWPVPLASRSLHYGSSTNRHARPSQPTEIARTPSPVRFKENRSSSASNRFCKAVLPDDEGTGNGVAGDDVKDFKPEPVNFSVPSDLATGAHKNIERPTLFDEVQKGSPTTIQRYPHSYKTSSNFDVSEVSPLSSSSKKNAKALHFVASPSVDHSKRSNVSSLLRLWKQSGKKQSRNMVRTPLTDRVVTDINYIPALPSDRSPVRYTIGSLIKQLTQLENMTELTSAQRESRADGHPPDRSSVRAESPRVSIIDELVNFWDAFHHCDKLMGESRIARSTSHHVTNSKKESFSMVNCGPSKSGSLVGELVDEHGVPLTQQKTTANKIDRVSSDSLSLKHPSLTKISENRVSSLRLQFDNQRRQSHTEEQEEPGHRKRLSTFIKNRVDHFQIPKSKDETKVSQ